MNPDNMTVLGLYTIQKVKQSLPIEDLMEWLIKEHPQAELKQILAMLNVIYQENFKITPASNSPKNYRIGDKELTAFPQRVEELGI
jgi:hypothetical protein